MHGRSLLAATKTQPILFLYSPATPISKGLALSKGMRFTRHLYHGRNFYVLQRPTIAEDSLFKAATVRRCYRRSHVDSRLARWGSGLAGSVKHVSSAARRLIWWRAIEFTFYG